MPSTPNSFEDIHTAKSPASSRRMASRAWLSYRSRQAILLKAAAALLWLGPRHAQAFGILTYHRVAQDVGPDPGLLNVTPLRFRQQLTGLLRLGYQPLALRRLLEQRERGESTSRRAFAVVFDDGYADMFHNAWPVLRELQIPATVFLATQYLDTNQRFPFDDWSTDVGPLSLPLATEQCRVMSADGLIDFGSHTHTHIDFRDRPQEFATDMRQSLAWLEQQLGVRRPLFSFPYGLVQDELIIRARQLGVACGLSAMSQLVTPAIDPYHWGRFGATQLDTSHTLAAKLDGWYTTLQTVWRRCRFMARPSRPATA